MFGLLGPNKHLGYEYLSAWSVVYLRTVRLIIWCNGNKTLLVQLYHIDKQAGSIMPEIKHRAVTYHLQTPPIVQCNGLLTS